MIHIIPIVPATLDIIEVLNNGVRPQVEDEETFYVYKGKDEITKIITLAELQSSPEYDEWMTIVKIAYKSE